MPVTAAMPESPPLIRLLIGVSTYPVREAEEERARICGVRIFLFRCVHASL